MLRISSLFKNLVMSFPVKGSEELRLTRPEGLVETWGKWTLTVAKGDRSPPQVLRGRRSCLRRTKGLLRHAFLSARSGLTKFRSVA